MIQIDRARLYLPRFFQKWFFHSLFLITVTTGCHNPRVPDTRVSQYSYGVSVKALDGELRIDLENPLHSPLRIWVLAEEGSLQKRLDTVNPIVLQPMQDTVVILAHESENDPGLRLRSRLGDPTRPVINGPVSLPFPENHSYKVIQGHQSRPTHNTDWSRFAVDLDLDRKDTICAADDGYVVGVVEAYQYGGADPKWKPYGNFVTLYHPSSGLYTQYVHLDHLGSLVRLGDTVQRGAPIGLAGMTGQTNIQHLHFNALVPDTSEAGLKSVPVDFIEGYRGAALRRGMQVTK